jgi:hypothetical protein
MPIINRQPEPLTLVPTGVLPEPAAPAPAPSTGEVLTSAFERNNLIGSAFTNDYNFAGIDNSLDPNYSAWNEIKGTPYESKWNIFASSNNHRYTDALKLQIDQEDKNNRTLAAGGWTSTAANLAAGILDPTIFIPVGGEIAKGAEGYRILRAGARTAIAGGVATAAQETGLQATQETRPVSESVENVGFGTILSGIVGTGAAAIFSKGEAKAAQKGFDTILNDTTQPASAGAAATTHSLGLENLTVDPKMGAGKIAEATQNLNPGLRLNFSPSPVARQLGQELGESSVYNTGHEVGLTAAPGGAVERQAIMKFRAKDAAGLRALNEAYSDMGKTGVNMSFDDFATAVGHALSNGDKGDNEFISTAAKNVRSSVFDPLFAEGKAVGVWKEGDDVKFAESYFPRQYRKDEMIGRENEIKPQLNEEMHKVISARYSAAAKAFRKKIADLEPEAAKKETNKFRNLWEGKNLGNGVDPHDPNNSPNFSNLSKLIIDDWYDKVTGRDHGSSAAIAPDYMTPVERGPIKERTLPISDAALTKMGILEKRADIVLRNFSRMVSGDIELTRKYGNPTMEDQFKTLKDDYAGLVKAAGNDPKKLKSLDSNFRHDQRDISAMRDLIRGMYRMEQNTSSYARAVGVANRFNFIRKMGHVVIRSLSDMARIPMVHGLLPFMRDGILPLVHSFEAVKLSNAESKLMAITVDHELQFRAMALSNISDPFERGTPFERFMENLSRIATKVTLLPHWNDLWKGIASRVSQNQILSGALDQRTRTFLGIDPAMWDAIKAQHATHGEIVDGIHIPNTEQWTDENAVRAFRAAVGKDVDSIIVTPGYADQPLLAHRPTGRLLLQFKSYEFASHSKVMLRGLQEGKAKFVAGMISMSTLGMLSSALAAWTGGRIIWEKWKKAAQNPGYLIGEGLDQAGIFALPFDVADTSERVSNTLHYHLNPIKTPVMAVGSWAYPESSQQGKNIRYRDENLADVLLGPSIGSLEDLGLATSLGVDKARGKKTSRAQQKAAIRLLPLNNFYGVSESIQALTGDSPYDPNEKLAVKALTYGKPN